MLPFADQTTSTIVAEKEYEYEYKDKDLHFRRGSPLACGVMGIVCSS